MLLSKVNRRASGNPQPRKKTFTHHDLKKVPRKSTGAPQIKFPASKPETKSLPGAQNKIKTNANRVKPTEIDLLPPSDSEEEWNSRGRRETFWRPLHRLAAKEPAEKDNHSVKAQAKVEFDNISKRINKVFDDYEYQLQVKRTEASNEALPIVDEEKDNLRGVLSDYMDVCDERKELLYQLQEWFEEDHLKEDLFKDEDFDAGDIQGLKKTLMDRQKVKRKLHMIKFDLENRAMMVSNQQKMEKAKMETELVEAKKALEKMKSSKPGMIPLTGAAAADNANSWKYAAAEIHQILAKARDAGTANLQVMEQKLAEMVVNMTEQASLVTKLQAELEKKEEILNGNEVEISALERHKNDLTSNLEKVRTELVQDKMVIDSQKQTNEELDNVIKELQEKIALLSQRIEELQNENKELKEKAAKAAEELAALPTPSTVSSPTKTTPKTPRSRASRASITPIPPTPTVSTHNVGVQVGGIFLDPKMISLPDKTAKHTSNVAVQCIEDEPLKSEVQVEHETQIERLKSSLQVAYKEISEMQCLIEELQSQVLPSPVPHRSEDEMSTPSVTTSIPSPDPSPEPTPMQPIVKVLSKSTSDSIPTNLQRRHTLQTEHPVYIGRRTSKSLSRMSLPNSRSSRSSRSRSTASPDVDPNWIDVVSFTKLNMTPLELQDTMKQMLMLENDPNSVTKSIVANALEQVNVNTNKVSNMISNDNLTSFQEELANMCDAIAGFLDYSSGLVEKEAKVISDAVASLLAKLPEEEKAKVNKTNEMKEKLQEKIADIVEPAFSALQKGGELISSNMKQQNESLQAAMNALAEYKKRQRSSYQFEIPLAFDSQVEKQYELLPLREKVVPDKQGGMTVRYDEQPVHRRYHKGLMVPKLAKFPIIHGYHFGGGRLMYYDRPRPTSRQYGKNQRGMLSINATGYYNGLAGRTAASQAYRMATHPPKPTKHHKKFLRPISRRRGNSLSIYKPGNILAPLSTQQSQFHRTLPPKSGDSNRRTYGQSNYLDVISNPEYFGRPFVHPSANVQIKATNLPPISRQQNQN